MIVEKRGLINDFRRMDKRIEGREVDRTITARRRMILVRMKERERKREKFNPEHGNDNSSPHEICKTPSAR